MDFSTYSNEKIDIHHIFPKDYCIGQKYDKLKWNSIVNKTPISASSNREIGGVAPSIYLGKLEKRALYRRLIWTAMRRRIGSTTLCWGRMNSGRSSLIALRNCSVQSKQLPAERYPVKTPMKCSVLLVHRWNKLFSVGIMGNSRAWMMWRASLKRFDRKLNWGPFTAALHPLLLCRM